MNPTELTLFILVIIIGAVLLRRAHLLGIKQKKYFENDALERIERDIKEIKSEIDSYSIYRHIPFFGQKNPWGKSTYNEMKKEILQNCTKHTGGGGDVYYLADYSLLIKNKKIYYVVGKNDYNFNEFTENT